MFISPSIYLTYICHIYIYTHKYHHKCFYITNSTYKHSPPLFRNVTFLGILKSNKCSALQRKVNHYFIP